MQAASIVVPALWGPIPRPPQGHSWESLMDAALALAGEAGAADEIPVGALVVTAAGQIVGRGRNAPLARRDPTAHAEVLALREAGVTLGNYRLEGCVMVVTLEPCLMCVGAMVHARLAGVVYGACDCKTGAVASCLDGLALPFHNHSLWHLGGVRGAACAALLHDFFRTRRPV